MKISLQDAAREAGVPYATMRKHVERGRMRTTLEDGRTYIEQEDFEAYMAAKTLEDAARNLRGASLDQIGIEMGHTIARLPQKVRDAILEGMPQKDKAGRPGPFLEAEATFGTRMPKSAAMAVALKADDPHHGFRVGYQHETSPRWKRISKTTWALGPASYMWDGSRWVPGGSRSTYLAEGISPASPFAELRPLAPTTARAHSTRETADD